MEVRLILQDLSPQQILSVACDAFRGRIFSGSEDNTIKVWDFQNGDLIKTINHHSGWVTSVLFLKKRRLLVSGSLDGHLAAWNPNFKLIHTQNVGKPISCLAWEQTKKHLVVGAKNEVYLYSFPRRGTVSQTDAVTNLEFHKVTSLLNNGDFIKAIVCVNGRILVGCFDHSIRIIEAGSLRTIMVLRNAHTAGISCMTLVGDINDTFITGSYDKSIKVWTFDGSNLQYFKGLDDCVSGMIYNPILGSLWVASNSENLQVFDIHSGTNITEYLCGISSNFTASSSNTGYEPLNETSSGLDSGNRIIGEYISSLTPRHYQLIERVPDTGELIITTSLREIMIWKFNPTKPLTILHGHQQSVESLTYSPLSQQIYSGSSDCTVRRWEQIPQDIPASATFRSSHNSYSCEIMEGQGEVLSVCYYQQLDTVVTVSSDKAIRIWSFVDLPFRKDTSKRSVNPKNIKRKNFDKQTKEHFEKIWSQTSSFQVSPTTSPPRTPSVISRVTTLHQLFGSDVETLSHKMNGWAYEDSVSDDLHQRVSYHKNSRHQGNRDAKEWIHGKQRQRKKVEEKYNYDRFGDWPSLKFEKEYDYARAPTTLGFGSQTPPFRGPNSNSRPNSAGLVLISTDDIEEAEVLPPLVWRHPKTKFRNRPVSSKKIARGTPVGDGEPENEKGEQNITPEKERGVTFESPWENYVIERETKEKQKAEINDFWDDDHFDYEVAAVTSSQVEDLAGKATGRNHMYVLEEGHSKRVTGICCIHLPYTLLIDQREKNQGVKRVRGSKSEASHKEKEKEKEKEVDPEDVWGEGHFIVSVSLDMSFCIWNMNTNSKHLILKFDDAHKDGILGVAYSVENNHFATCSQDCTIKIWNFDPYFPKLVNTINASTELTHIYWNKVNQSWVTSGTDQTICEWSDKGDLLYLVRMNIPITTFCIDQKLGYIVLATSDHKIHVVDQKTERILVTHNDHSDIINDIIHIPEMNQYVSAGWDRNLRIWKAFQQPLKISDPLPKPSSVQNEVENYSNNNANNNNNQNNNHQNNTNNNSNVKSSVNEGENVANSGSSKVTLPPLSTKTLTNNMHSLSLDSNEKTTEEVEEHETPISTPNLVGANRILNAIFKGMNNWDSKSLTQTQETQARPSAIVANKGTWSEDLDLKRIDSMRRNSSEVEDNLDITAHGNYEPYNDQAPTFATLHPLTLPKTMKKNSERVPIERVLASLQEFYGRKPVSSLQKPAQETAFSKKLDDMMETQFKKKERKIKPAIKKSPSPFSGLSSDNFSRNFD